MTLLKVLLSKEKTAVISYHKHMLILKGLRRKILICGNISTKFLSKKGLSIAVKLSQSKGKTTAKKSTGARDICRKGPLVF